MAGVVTAGEKLGTMLRSLASSPATVRESKDALAQLRTTRRKSSILIAVVLCDIICLSASSTRREETADRFDKCFAVAYRENTAAARVVLLGRPARHHCAVAIINKRIRLRSPVNIVVFSGQPSCEFIPQIRPFTVKPLSECALGGAGKSLTKVGDAMMVQHGLGAFMTLASG